MFSGRVSSAVKTTSRHRAASVVRSTSFRSQCLSVTAVSISVRRTTSSVRLEQGGNFKTTSQIHEGDRIIGIKPLDRHAPGRALAKGASKCGQESIKQPKVRVVLFSYEL